MARPTATQPIRRPTQQDVARLAGVSRATVSYVLNGLTNGKVAISPETQARVQEAIAALGYEPDAGAQALRSGSTKTIGLIIPDLNNPHFWQNADGVERGAREAGYRLLLSSMDLNAQYGEDVFKDLSGRRIDALIVMGGIIAQAAARPDSLGRNLKRRLPIVEINDHVQQQYKTDCVISDYRAAAQEAMANLLMLGHRRIGMVFGVAAPELAVDRLEPYRAGLQRAGLPVTPELIAECGPTIEDGYRAAQQLLAQPQRPTAILAINDLLAIGVLRAAGDLGLQVPKDLSLVGFDDIPEAKYLVPRLTTASKDAVRMGREAVRLALSRLQAPSQPRQIVEVQSRFVVRESTGPAPHGM